MMDGLEFLTEWQSALIAFALFMAFYLAVMWVAAIVWTFHDIRARTEDPFEQAASVLLVAVFNIPGLLLHVLMRPKTTIEDRMDRRLEAEAMFQDIQERPACPQCAGRIQPDFILCPLCRAELRTPCRSCGKAIAIDWAMCPYCTADALPAVTPLERRRASGAPRPTLSNGRPRPALAGGRPRA